MNILNKEWRHKIQHLLYIEYRKNDDLSDDKHYDIISLSHGKLFKIHIDENDEGQNKKIEEINDIKKLMEDYNFLKYDWISFNLIDELYEETDIQPYHKMHFDIKSDDGTYGLILFKKFMIELSYCDVEDILYDCKEKPIQEIKEYYKEQSQELDEYFADYR